VIRTSAEAIRLRCLPGAFAVHRLPPDAPVPEAVNGAGFAATVRTADELSIVCDARLAVSASRTETGFRCLQVAGPLDFALTGIVSRLSAPLAAAGIPIFVISSFDTDYLLIRATDLDDALAALAAAGISLIPASGNSSPPRA
jgi:hypothetical protein